MANPYQQYQNNAILTASPKELTLMLYDGIIRFCNQAIDAMEKEDLQKAHQNIIRAQDIVEELVVTLDDKYPIAKEIKPLYIFMNERLIDANIQKAKEPVEDVIYLVREFRDVWKQISSKV